MGLGDRRDRSTASRFASIELAYDRFGPDAGRTLVLLHGLTNGRATYSDLVPWLQERGLGVVNVDLRGHGDTGWADSYQASDYAADVAGLIAGLGVASVVVVGHSLGGVVAATVAGLRTDLVEALFMEDPPLFQGDPAVRSADPSIEGMPELADQIRRWQQPDVHFDDVAGEYGESESPYPGVTMLDLLGSDRLATRVEGYLRCDPAAIEATYDGRLWEGYDPATTVRCPVTVLAADPSLDGMFLPEHADRYVEVVPQARIVPVTGVAHSIRLRDEGREVYLRELSALLDSL